MELNIAVFTNNKKYVFPENADAIRHFYFTIISFSLHLFPRRPPIFFKNETSI